MTIDNPELKPMNDMEKLAKVREAVGWAIYKINSRTEAHEASKYITEALSILDSMGVK